MPKFFEIDYESWDRKEIYEAFSPCRYTLSAMVDITDFAARVKGAGLRFYAAVNYAIASVLNADSRFRYAKQNGKVGYFDRVDPLYTLLRKNSDLFTHKVTRYSADFTKFYNQFGCDYALAEQCNRLYYDAVKPPNAFSVSVVPDVSFTSVAFNYNIEADGAYFPFITVGKFFNQDGKIMLPVAAEFHHEINDGYHAGQFFKMFESFCKEFSLPEDLNAIDRVGLENRQPIC